MKAALAHRDQLPPLPPTVPAQVAALGAELTARDPAVRPATAGEAARRAGQLRDALTSGAAGRPGRWPDSPGAQPTGRSAAIPDADRATLAEVPLPEPLRRSRRLRPARGVAVAVTAAAVTAGLAGWLLGGMSSAAAPDQHTAVRPSATAAAGPLAAAPVQVSGGALDGLPVTAVRRQLRQLGLRVLVLWRPSGQQPPGTVLSVQPDGRVPAGSIVVVTAALQPPGHQGNSGGNANGGGD